jgi:hypothetical protein
VKADVFPQLIGPLHRDRLRSNESEFIRSTFSSIQKRGHLHCLSLVINTTSRYPRGRTAPVIVVAVDRRVPDTSTLMKAGGATLYSVRNEFRVHARRSQPGEYSALSNLPVNPIGHAPTRYQAPRKSRTSYRQLPGWQLGQHPSSSDVCIHDSPQNLFTRHFRWKDKEGQVR